MVTKCKTGFVQPAEFLNVFAFTEAPWSGQMDGTTVATLRMGKKMGEYINLVLY